jgi:putative transcriptional regulator
VKAVPIKYDRLFQMLKEKGWNTTRIRKENLLGQRTMTALRHGTGGLDHRSIAKLCKALDCQPGDLMEYVDESAEPEQAEQTAEPMQEETI